MGISNIIFLLLFVGAFVLFALRIKTIVRNIRLGRDKNMNDNFAERLKVMSLVAIGQSKMVVRPVAGIMHIFIYIGFVIMNIELLEIVIDGVAGTHRVFAFLGGFYDFVIGSFEFLGLGVLVACIVFLIRRNIIKLKRFWSANDFMAAQRCQLDSYHRDTVNDRFLHHECNGSGIAKPRC